MEVLLEIGVWCCCSTIPCRKKHKETSHQKLSPEETDPSGNIERGKSKTAIAASATASSSKDGGGSGEAKPEAGQMGGEVKPEAMEI
ncbi:hypothetical protein JCGZ_18004 [Jatropha curcas]|uniref:Uncharacterized protein n=1 Tax=Jatropha curcas TaxID=180498 RepID=A0A067JSB2_JATCU|nr:hypothetical protein JCGZ_18004 [Jatropha curcas]